MDELLKWRGEEFSDMGRTTYMSQFVGRADCGVYQGLRLLAIPGRNEEVAHGRGLVGNGRGVGAPIAPLIGAGPGDVSLHQR